jgi:nicotinamide mononucleotide transporter
LATWLTARVKLENWIYWLVIDGTLAFLFAAQGLYLYALLSVVYLGVSAVGFVKWLKTYRNPLPAS